MYGRSPASSPTSSGCTTRSLLMVGAPRRAAPEHTREPVLSRNDVAGYGKLAADATHGGERYHGSFPVEPRGSRARDGCLDGDPPGMRQ